MYLRGTLWMFHKPIGLSENCAAQRDYTKRLCNFEIKVFPFWAARVYHRASMLVEIIYTLHKQSDVENTTETHNTLRNHTNYWNVYFWMKLQNLFSP